MSNFGNYAFNKSNNNNPSGYQDVTKTLEQFANEFEELLEPYKGVMQKEFNNLNKNNEKWKADHNGEGCQAFEEKMWALSAPVEIIKIIRKLYVNRVYKDN